MLTGCEPVSIWGIYRHGKREPGAKFAESMKQALPIRNYITTSYKKGRSSLCAQDVENLQNWQLNQNTLNGKSDLTEEGRQEMLGLSKRLKEVFPDLLSELRNGDYSFRSASGSWIEKSIQHFVKGLGDDLTIEKVKAGADVMAVSNKFICLMFQQLLTINILIFLLIGLRFLLKTYVTRILLTFLFCVEF